MDPIGEDGVFAVEALLKSKKIKGKIHYLVKWKGWSSKHNTWEPADNVLDDRLVEAFEEKQAKGKKRSSTGSRKSDPVSSPSPAKKRPKRLAGGDIRDESSESSEHDTSRHEEDKARIVADNEEESPSTSRPRKGRKDRSGASASSNKDEVEKKEEADEATEGDKEEADEAPKDEAEAEGHDEDLKDDETSVVPEHDSEKKEPEEPKARTEDAEEAKDDTNETAENEAEKNETDPNTVFEDVANHVEENPAATDAEAGPSEDIDLQRDSVLLVLAESETMELEQSAEADQLEELHLPSAETEQQKQQAIEEIKREIRDEMKTWIEQESSSGDDNMTDPFTMHSTTTVKEATYNNQTIQYLEF